MRKLNVIIVEDHPIYRDGLFHLLTTFPEIVFLELATDGYDFLKKINQTEFDLVLMDIKMPGLNGIEVIQKVRESNQTIKFIVISAFESADYVDRALAAGASGYILKEAGQDEIREAIVNVAEGRHYFSQKIMNEIAARVGNRINRQIIDLTIPSLTDRELEILRLICQGQNRQSIAQNLFISERTFDKHKENILTKTNTSNSVSLVLFAIKNKLVDISYETNMPL